MEVSGMLAYYPTIEPAHNRQEAVGRRQAAVELKWNTGREHGV